MASAVEVKGWFRRFDALVAELDGCSVGETQAMCAVGRAKLDAAEARVLAGEVPADGDTRRAARMAGADGKRSKASARKAAKRARAVAKNQDLADDLDSGRLSPEQLDLIADAMDTDESAATDQNLIDKIADASVDQGRKIARDWKTKQDRQGRSGSGRTNANDDYGRARPVLQQVPRAWTRSCSKATPCRSTSSGTCSNNARRQLHQADGGRDLSSGCKHPRTREQRLFDALHDPPHRHRRSTSMARPSAVLAVPGRPERQCAELVGSRSDL